MKKRNLWQVFLHSLCCSQAASRYHIDGVYQFKSKTFTDGASADLSNDEDVSGSVSVA